MKIVLSLVLLWSFQAQGVSTVFALSKPNEFFAGLKAEKEIEDLRQKCNAQDQENQFPFWCMILARKSVLNFSDQGQWQSFWQHISEQCVNTAQKEGSETYLKQALGEAALSSRCLSQIRERLADLKYIGKKAEDGGHLAPILNSISP